MRRCDCRQCGLELMAGDIKKYHPDCPNRAAVVSKNRSEAATRRWQAPSMDLPAYPDDISAEEIERKFQEALAEQKAMRKRAA